MPSEIQLNIAIVPNPQIQTEAIMMSKLLKDNFDTHFVLNIENLIPHITISQARYPERNLSKVIDVVKEKAKGIEKLSIELDLFDLFIGQFVFWNAIHTQELVDLHQQIVDKTNSLREGLVIQHVAAMQNLSPDDLSDRGKYGALLIGPRYKPHITLTRLKETKSLGDIIKILGANKHVSFAVDKVIIGYLGNHGTVNGIIEEINLN